MPRGPAVAGSLIAAQAADREHRASGLVRQHAVSDVWDEDRLVLPAAKRTDLPQGWWAGRADLSAQGV